MSEDETLRRHLLWTTVIMGTVFAVAIAAAVIIELAINPDHSPAARDVATAYGYEYRGRDGSEYLLTDGDGYAYVLTCDERAGGVVCSYPQPVGRWVTP